ncbi:unnamed protein product, partial [Rotaria sp. Silwood1]
MPCPAFQPNQLITEIYDDEHDFVDVDIIVLHDADASSLLPTAVPADKEYDDSLPIFSSSTNDENNQILKALHKTHALVVRTRKLVKLMRNVSAIDQYVRNHQDGPKNGFVIDIR